MLHTKYQSSKPCDFREEDFFKVFNLKIFFSLCELDMQCTKTNLNIFKEGHIRIIPTKFGKKSASSLRDPLKQLLTTDDAHSTITITRHEPQAQGT